MLVQQMRFFHGAIPDAFEVRYESYVQENKNKLKQ